MKDELDPVDVEHRLTLSMLIRIRNIYFEDNKSVLTVDFVNNE